jgi:hypothetical protein
MSPDDALRLASWIDGLFADATPQQVSFLADQFAPFDAAVVEAEVNRYRRQFETLNISNLLRRIADEQQKRSPSRNASRLEREKIEAQWERDEAAIAKLSDDELKRHKEAVLAERPALSKFLRDKDPRESLMLRSLILEKRLRKNAGK